MPANTGKLTVTGQAEVNKALEAVEDFDVVAAESGAVNALLPAIQSKTRRRYGILAAAWTGQASSFVNSMPYAVVQEFGSIYVEPTLAIQRSWDDGQDSVISAFNKEIYSAASKAGFDT